MHFCDVVGWCCWDVVCDIVDTVAVRSLLAAYVQDQVFYYSCLSRVSERVSQCRQEAHRT